MTPPAFDLGKLLNPLTIQEFFSTYWERRYRLLARDDARYYESLMTTADLEAVISDADGRYPAIRLAKGGGYFAPETYTRNIGHGEESFAGVPDVQKISEEYRRGATVALPAMHRRWKALGVLCEQLQAELDHPAHANVYITPGNAAGFTPHYDTHEVFVLQIAGRKRWSIYAPLHELPHRSQVFTPHAYAGQAPMAEIELKAGDLLYLPRGFVHSTTTSESFSAHVTLGITVYTGVDLIKEYLQAAVADHELRRALPPGFASRSDSKSLLRKRLLQALDRLRATADVDQLIESFTQRVKAAHIPRPAPFKADVSVVTLDSVLQSPPPESFRFIKGAGNTLLEFNGVQYQIPAPVESTIRSMSELRTFRGAELGDPLDADARLILIRHLMDIGFLRR